MELQNSIFQLADDIGNILVEETAGKYKSDIENLYHFSMYLVYCADTNYSTHIKIFEPMYKKYSKIETDSQSEQYRLIMELSDKYKIQLKKIDSELAQRAEEFASDSLYELNKRIIKKN